MPRGNPLLEIDIGGTPEQIARRAHLANTVCAACHTINDEIPLSGGKNMLEDVPMPLGSCTPPLRGRVSQGSRQSLGVLWQQFGHRGRALLAV